MSDVKQCDRCESVVDTTTWVHSLRAEVTFKRHTSAATAYNPDEYELCKQCAEDLRSWLDQ